jgi:hypothetical protein
MKAPEWLLDLIDGFYDWRDGDGEQKHPPRLWFTSV